MPDARAVTAITRLVRARGITSVITMIGRWPCLRAISSRPRSRSGIRQVGRCSQGECIIIWVLMSAEARYAWRRAPVCD